MSGLGFKPCRIMPKNKKSPKREAKDLSKRFAPGKTPEDRIKARFSNLLEGIGHTDSNDWEIQTVRDLLDVAWDLLSQDARERFFGHSDVMTAEKRAIELLKQSDES